MRNKQWAKVAIILFTFQLLLMSVSCTNGEEHNMIALEFENYPNKNWEDSVGTYTQDVIPNKESAVEVASAIYRHLSIASEEQSYTPQAVFYDKTDRIWIVSFSDASKKDTVGGDCSIALQQKDGKVLRIWFGE